MAPPEDSKSGYFELCCISLDNFINAPLNSPLTLWRCNKKLLKSMYFFTCTSSATSTRLRWHWVSKLCYKETNNCLNRVFITVTLCTMFPCFVHILVITKQHTRTYTVYRQFYVQIQWIKYYNSSDVFIYSTFHLSLTLPLKKWQSCLHFFRPILYFKYTTPVHISRLSQNAI